MTNPGRPGSRAEKLNTVFLKAALGVDMLKGPRFNSQGPPKKVALDFPESKTPKKRAGGGLVGGQFSDRLTWWGWAESGSVKKMSAPRSSMHMSAATCASPPRGPEVHVSPYSILGLSAGGKHKRWGE